MGAAAAGLDAAGAAATGADAVVVELFPATAVRLLVLPKLGWFKRRTPPRPLTVPAEINKNFFMALMRQI